MVPLDTRFLLVDDYSNIRNLLKQQLSNFGFTGEFLEAENVDNAISIITERNLSGKDPIGFVLSDWNMPGKTGLDFLKWFRSHQALQNLPFLILTTENEQEKVLSAVQAGVSNFLIKPWEQDSLAEKLALCFQKHNA